MILFWQKIKKNYPQVYLEEYKYKKNSKKTGKKKRKSLNSKTKIDNELESGSESE